MRQSPTITGIETIAFEWLHPRGQAKALAAIHHANAIRVFTDAGVTGEYVGGWPLDHDAVRYFAHLLVGRDALDRLTAYELGKHVTRQNGRVGYSVVDIALWDLAGKWYDAPVFELLGGKRRPLPAYASTTIGDDDPDGLGSGEAYARFAERCYDLGYRAFKIHGWLGGDLQKEIDIADAVGRAVGTAWRSWTTSPRPCGRSATRCGSVTCSTITATCGTRTRTPIRGSRRRGTVVCARSCERRC